MQSTLRAQLCAPESRHAYGGPPTLTAHASTLPGDWRPGSSRRRRYVEDVTRSDEALGARRASSLGWQRHNVQSARSSVPMRYRHSVCEAVVQSSGQVERRPRAYPPVDGPPVYHAA